MPKITMKSKSRCEADLYSEAGANLGECGGLAQFTITFAADSQKRVCRCHLPDSLTPGVINYVIPRIEP